MMTYWERGVQRKFALNQKKEGSFKEEEH